MEERQRIKSLANGEPVLQAMEPELGPLVEPSYQLVITCHNLS